MMTLPNTYPTPKVIAEIGCNHKGEMETAKELISIASAFCRADVAKFQKRNPKELLSKEQYNAPHPNEMHSYGSTYGEHREFLELTLDEHRQLQDWCGEFNIQYSSSVWDMTSAKEITRLQPTLIKVGSATNTHRDMLALLCNDFSGEIHVSLGMTTREEEQELVKFFEDRGRAKDVVLYSCTSGYPVAFADVCLLEIVRIRGDYAGVVKSIGFSGHHLGIAVDVAAYTLGAEWVERHFTLDRTWKGTDHAASLEPQGLRRVVRDLKATREALKFKANEILPIESKQRDKLKFRIESESN